MFPRYPREKGDTERIRRGIRERRGNAVTGFERMGLREGGGEQEERISAKLSDSPPFRILLPKTLLSGWKVMHIYKANNLSVKNTKHMYTHIVITVFLLGRIRRGRKSFHGFRKKTAKKEATGNSHSKTRKHLLPSLPLSLIFSLRGWPKSDADRRGIGIPGTQFGRILF